MTRLPHHRFAYAAALAGLLLLGGCAGPAVRSQDGAAPAGQVPLAAGHTVGQTFVAVQAGLDGVAVWLAGDQAGTGEIRLRLRVDAQAHEDLRGAAMPVSAVTAPGLYRFTFSPLGDSEARYYYAFLEVVGEGAVQVGTEAAEARLDGALYRDHRPADAQMLFQASYDSLHRAQSLVRAGLAGLGRLLLGGLLYVVPGWALMLAVRKRGGYLPVGHWAEGLGVAAGLSLAIYPLLMLWTNLVGLHLGPLYTWLPVASGVVVLAWHYRPWRWAPAQTLAFVKGCRHSDTFWPDLALIVVVLLAALGRLLMVRNLDMPLWDDSVSHVTIVQRMLESGGLFSSWEPYAPYSTLSVHFGFHSDAAVWAWLTGNAAPQAVLWAAQVLNLLAVVALYPLAYRVKGAWGGVFAVLVAGVIAVFPAYYVNWGRYTQMTGQVILPIAAWWLWVTWREEKGRGALAVGWLLTGAGLVGGMALTYYRMLLHLVAFGVATLLIPVSVTRRWAARWNVLALALAAVLSVTLVLPWVQNIAGQHDLTRAAGTAASDGGLNRLWQQLQAVYLDWPSPQTAVVVLGIIAGMWGGAAAFLPVVWLCLVVALPVLRLMPLPGTSLLEQFAIDISLYMPQALVWGALLGHLGEKAMAAWRWWGAILAVGVVGMAVWRAPALLTVADPVFGLATRPDVRAAAWIERSLPADAFFLINGMPGFGGFVPLASDAGSWLPALAHRDVLIPPQYTLLFEKQDQPGFGDAVNELVAALFQVPSDSPAGHQAICGFPRPITHVYVGQRQGMAVNALAEPPGRAMLSAQVLLHDPAFRLVYRQDRVLIFEFNRGVCP